MKKTAIVIGLVMVGAPVVQAADHAAEHNQHTATASSAKQKTQKKETTKKMEKKAEKYHCPMDTDVISDKPGKCPKCGMDMVKMNDMPSTTK